MTSIFGVSGYEVVHKNSKNMCNIHCFGRTLVVSLDDLKIIKGKGEIDQSKEEEILNWVISNKDFLLA